MTSSNANVEAIYPLTPVQEGILFHTLYAAESPLYIQQYACVLEGALDQDVFEEAWASVVARHPALRSLFTWEGRQQPLQIVKGAGAMVWRNEDWRHDPPDTHAARLDTFLESDREQGLQLDVAPLMRLALFRTADKTHRFVWTHHHLIVDGWSMGVVLDEVFRTYEALLAGHSPDLPDPPAYRDYVRWLKAQDWGLAEVVWRKALAGFEVPTPLRLGDQAPGSQWAERHAEGVVRLDAGTTARLAGFARDNGLTMNTLVRGAWALVLSRYVGSEDVVFGATVSGRPPELDGALEMVGMFINTIPVRVQIAPDDTVVEWLGGIQHAQIEASLHETAPLVAIQGWSDLPRGEQLFETLVVFENVPNPGSRSTALETTGIQYLQRSNYPLAILVMPGDELEFVFLFDADRFDESVIGRMAQQLLTALQALAVAGDRHVADVSVFPESELDEILDEWNATGSDYPDDRTIHSLIREAAAADPDRPAAAGSGGTVTYAELVERADEVTAQLRVLGIGAGDRVGIHIDRSAGMVVAILGVLQAGCAYVPLDPSLPAARIEFLLGDTAAKAIVTADPALGSELPVVQIDEAGRGAAGRTRGLRTGDDHHVGPDDLAYVIHTSGSTGAPKGVAVTHRNLVNSTYARLGAYVDPVEQFLLLSPFGFDSSVAGIFSTLTQAGTLVLPGPRMEQDVGHLARLVKEHAVTHTLALPTLYALLLELAEPSLLQSLRLVMVAGEHCPPELVRRHYEVLPHARLVNEYGPTEATVWATVHHFDPAATDAVGRVPIGRPIANTQVYILDTMGRPVPVGVPGELHIGGHNVAQGYLDRLDLTAERFVTREVAGRGEVRLYRTGDVARYLADGSIDLLGRIDHQVKIRGQRIELGEVEAVLRRHPTVGDAVAVMEDGPPASLVAFVESGESTDTADLRAFVAAELPDAMVPAVVVVLEQLPRGATGKIDRVALPRPAARATDVAIEFVEPRGAVEEQIAAIWRDVLGCDRVGAHDNFFELGGDSILSIRIIARAHGAGLALTPKQFFANPTVAGLAAVAGR